MKTNKLECAKNMPPLFHKLPGENFDLKKSEVINWLISQPDILQFLFDKANQAKYITYDPMTGKWQGNNCGR